MKSTLGAGAIAARQKRAERKPSRTSTDAPAFGAEATTGARPASSGTLAMLAEPLPADLDSRRLIELIVERLGSALPGFVVGAETEDSTGTRAAVMRSTGTKSFALPALDGPLAPDRVYVRTVADAGARLFVASREHGRAVRVLHRQTVDVAANLLAAALGERRAVERAQRAQLELSRAEKLASLGKLVTSVLHELNNPLTSILSYADLLASRLGARSDAADYLEPLRRIKGSAERVQIFARDLVFYSRPSSETAAQVSLGNVLDKAIFLCEHEFSAARVRVTLAIGLGSQRLYGVPDQLVRVFVNLFTNAAHAMSERGGTLTIEASEDDDDFATIAVTDEGEGVSATNVPKLFEPFFTTKAADKGMGLGLAIVHEIVSAHRGTIRVQSIPGRGTTFELRLPLARGD